MTLQELRPSLLEADMQPIVIWMEDYLLEQQYYYAVHEIEGPTTT